MPTVRTDRAPADRPADRDLLSGARDLRRLRRVGGDDDAPRASLLSPGDVVVGQRGVVQAAPKPFVSVGPVGDQARPLSRAGEAIEPCGVDGPDETRCSRTSRQRDIPPVAQPSGSARDAPVGPVQDQPPSPASRGDLDERNRVAVWIRGRRLAPGITSWLVDRTGKVTVCRDHLGVQVRHRDRHEAQELARPEVVGVEALSGSDKRDIRALGPTRHSHLNGGSGLRAGWVRSRGAGL